MKDKPVLIDLATTTQRIAAARRIVVTTHARADGDAIGCVAAMRRILAGSGKQVTAFLHEAVPPRYAFLQDTDSLRVWQAESAPKALADADLLLILDTCSAAQLEPIAPAIRAARLPKLAIDHHVTRDDVADEAYVDVTAAACAQLVMQICRPPLGKIDAVGAQLLYAGLALDTGWFRFSNANADAFTDAARLVGEGAKPNELYERLYLNEPLARARLVGALMSSFELLAGGRLAVGKLTRDIMARCGATQQMTEDLINEPQRVGSVVVCALLVEPAEDNAPIRVSLRSKRDINVAAIAQRFGGGGHQRAAGAKITGKLDDVARKVVDALVAAMPET